MEIRLGTLRNANDKQEIRFQNHISKESFDIIRKNILILEKFNSNSDLYSIFLINFLELSDYFQKTVDSLTLKQATKTRYSQSDFRIILRNSNRLLLNLLSSGRSLVDHLETHLIKKYKKESDEAKKFKLKTNEIFDTVFEYRFICKLRNYSQHCGFPITNIKFDVKNKKQGNKFEISTRLNAHFKRDELLQNFKKWGVQVKKDLESQPENFPVMWTVGKYYKCVEEIYNEFENIELQTIINPYHHLKEFLKNYGELTQDVEPCIFYNFQFSNPNSYENSEFSTLNIPIDLINEIESKLISTNT